MGADYFDDFGKGTDAEKVFDELHSDAAFEHGHGGYTGTIAEKGSFVLRSNTPMEITIARAFADADMSKNDHDKWGPAWAVPVCKAEDPGTIIGYLFYGNASS